MTRFNDVIAIDSSGAVRLEFWAADSLEDVCIRLSPAMALQAAEALLKAARAAMTK